MKNPQRIAKSLLLLFAALLNPALAAQQGTEPTGPAPTARPASTEGKGPTPSAEEAKAAAEAAELDAEIRQRTFRRNPDGVALDGYDAVSYHQKGGPVKGRKEFAHVHRGIAYWFASAENRDAFAKDADALEPPYGGWCAYAVIDGDKVEVDPTNYTIENGKVLLFYKGFWGDALEKWQRLTKQKTAKKAVASADQGFERIVAKDREAVVADRSKKAKAAAEAEAGKAKPDGKNNRGARAKPESKDGKAKTGG